MFINPLFSINSYPIFRTLFLLCFLLKFRTNGAQKTVSTSLTYCYIARSIQRHTLIYRCYFGANSPNYKIFTNLTFVEQLVPFLATLLERLSHSHQYTSIDLVLTFNINLKLKCYFIFCKQSYLFG